MQKKWDKLAKQEGITLVVLIVMIIIILILVSVGVRSLLDDGGAVDRAAETKLEERATKFLEASELWKLENGKLKEEQREPLEEALARMKKDGLVTEEEIVTILADENKSITISGKDNRWSKYISFRLDAYPTIASKFKNDDTGEIKIGDYVLYSPAGESATYTVENTYSGCTLGTEQTIVRDSVTNNLRWRVLDIKDGEIRLISDVPTTGTIYLGSASGYNNGVKILDDLCNTLYKNASFASKVQDLKIEDIEEKLKPTVLSQVHAPPYGTYPYAAYEINCRYPKLWEEEVGATINEVAMNGVLGLSEQPKAGGQTQYVTEGRINTATSITGYHTDWSLAAYPNVWTNSKYYELFINNGGNYDSYRLSSRCVHATPTSANFGLRSVQSETIMGGTMQMSDTGSSGGYGRVRPVVTLRSSVKVIGGNGTTGWIIK